MDLEHHYRHKQHTFDAFCKRTIRNESAKQQIDLIDGEEFISKIAEFGIGVKPVTTYEIDEEFFEKI